MKATKTVKIVDECNNVVATALVAEQDGLLRGQIDLGPMPAELRRRFLEYEEIIRDQVFSLLDDMEERIAATCFRAILDGGQEAAIEDLQIYPSTGRVSFRIVQSPNARLSRA